MELAAQVLLELQGNSCLSLVDYRKYGSEGEVLDKANRKDSLVFQSLVS